MAKGLAFATAVPRAAARQLDAGSVHLWRLPHARVQQRAPLRRLLAAYLDLPEATVELTEDARGKPALAPGLARHGGDRRLDFNWSHSGDFALVALALDLAVGVDVERHASNPRALDIARRFFDRSEAESLARLSGDARDHAFLKLWCAKEAVLKAAGEGLSFGLSRLVFRDHGGGDWRLARVDAPLGEAPAWWHAGFEAAPGYHGALAWRGAPRSIVALRPADEAES